MQNFGLFGFLNKLESTGKLSHDSNSQIQNFLDFNNKTLARLFLIFAGLYGLAFTMLGLITLFMGDWISYGQGVQLILSAIPVSAGVALFITAYNKHRASVMWMEVASYFLSLMIGLSIFLFAQSFEIVLKPDELIKIWLLLILPVLYIGRASGIALLYLGLNSIHMQPEFNFFMRGGDPELITKSMYFWFFFLAFIPHFLMHLNRNTDRQSFRMIYLGWLIAITIIFANILTIKAGQWFWAPASILGMYIVGKKYYAQNSSFLARPFQTIALLMIPILLISLSNKFLFSVLLQFDNVEIMEKWGAEQLIHFTLGLLFFAGIIWHILKNRSKHPEWNKIIIFLPAVVLFMLLCIYLDGFEIVTLTWWIFLVINLYVFVLAFHAMFQGSNNDNITYMIYGLFVLAQLMTSIYQNMDRANWVKALFFVGVGGLFYIIVMLFRDDLKTD